MIRKGVWIYDADEGENGQDYVVWKRAKMSLETEDKRKRRCDGAYYHKPDEVVDMSNYKAVCEWSGIVELKVWRRAYLEGDGVTGNYDPFAATRAEKFVVHPLVRDKFEKPGGFWASQGDCDARKDAAKAQAKLKENLASPQKKGAAIALMVEAHSIIEIQAHDIFKGLKGVAGGESTTSPTTVTQNVFWVLERLLKIAGFAVDRGGTWTPRNGEAVVRFFGDGALKSGRNVLRRVNGYKPSALKTYYLNHPDEAAARSGPDTLSQLDKLDDLAILAAADGELGADARGPDGLRYPAWVLRKKIEDARVARHPVDARVMSFSYVELDGLTVKLKPKVVVPYKGTKIPVGAELTVSFTFKTTHRGDAPSGLTPMITN